MQKESPRMVNPAGYIPVPKEPVIFEVEGIGRSIFDPPFAHLKISAMVAFIVVGHYLVKPSDFITIAERTDFFEIVDWDPDLRILKIRLIETG